MDAEKESAIVPPEISAYMSQIAKKRTPARSAASRANLMKAHEASRKDPLTLPCTCTGGNSLKASDHKTTCPRGRLLWQRERAAAARVAKAEKEQSA